MVLHFNSPMLFTRVYSFRVSHRLVWGHNQEFRSLGPCLSCLFCCSAHMYIYIYTRKSEQANTTKLSQFALVYTNSEKQHEATTMKHFGTSFDSDSSGFLNQKPKTDTNHKTEQRTNTRPEHQHIYQGVLPLSYDLSQ